MKWHIISGSVKVQVEAETVDAAIVSALRILPLTGFNQFFCCYEHGKTFEDGDTSWGLTEWYLLEAGYEEIKEGEYKGCWRLKVGKKNEAQVRPPRTSGPTKIQGYNQDEWQKKVEEAKN